MKGVERDEGVVLWFGFRMGMVLVGVYFGGVFGVVVGGDLSKDRGWYVCCFGKGSYLWFWL